MYIGIESDRIMECAEPEVMPLDTCTSKFNKGQHQGTFFKHTAEFVMNNIIIILCHQ